MENIIEYFEDVKIIKEHDGYYYSVKEAIVIVILGTFCGLKNISQIHQWATSERVSEFLKEKFKIKKVPCYYWLLCLMKLVKPESFNRCFINWVESLMPKKKEGLTIAIDGKTIRSTGKMEKYENPLHIVSAQIAELGVTFGQIATQDKSNEIPAVRELLEMLNIEGCIIVADALNCQKETAKTVINGKGDYLFSVKNNQETLKNDIEDYIQDETLRKNMDTYSTVEKNRNRIEKRTAYITKDIEWLDLKDKDGNDIWQNLTCVGAIHTEVESKNGKTSEWHYYISSRDLTPFELLKHARLEWSVETMHWLLDVHFNEDFCRIEDKIIQQNLNMLRKLVINIIKNYKSKFAPKRPISKIMLDCLLDCNFISKVIFQN